MAADLDKKHLLPFELWYDEFPAGYPTIRINNAHASATIALHGAHVMDYIPKEQEPVIFTSVKAQFKEGKAIRGGIPVCWPWFGAHPSDSSLPAHGVARNRFWHIESTESHKDYTEIVFSLESRVPSVWEKPTALKLTIRVGAQLELLLETTNTGTEEITISGALHSYFQVSDISQISVHGLEGAQLTDTVLNETRSQDGEIRFTGEVDSVYHGTDAAVTIQDPGFKRNIVIEKTGSKSTVVWNPWDEKAAALGDMEDAEYHDFVCVETANAHSDVYQIGAGESHTLGTIIRTIPLEG